MFLASIWGQMAIVAGVIIVFIVTYVLNKRTKAPKGVEIPEKCLNCQLDNCMIKTNNLNEVKKDFQEYLEKECKNNENNEKN